jgi:prepilin-type N-terminal cleavage/methylation domain-containing protein
MQYIRMSAGRARRGFTMIELLVALTLLGLVSAALYRVLVNNQRLYLAQTQRIDLSQNIRAAANILPAEFRELDAADGDITAMTATSIQIRAMRWVSFVCVAPLLAGVNANLTMTIRGGQTGQPMFFGSRGIRTTDSMLVYLDGDPTTRNDDYFVPAQITAAPALTCPAVGAVVAQPGTQVTFNGNFIAGTNVANAIPVGAPVWGFERVVYQLYQPPGDPNWYVGFQPAGGTMQPLIGPVLANGLSFTYYDVNGNVTAVRTQVARIDITVRAQTAIAVRAAGQAPAQQIVDSLSTSVALRNNRRF